MYERKRKCHVDLDVEDLHSQIKRRRSSHASSDSDFVDNRDSSSSLQKLVLLRTQRHHSRAATCREHDRSRRVHHCGCRGHSDSGCELMLADRVRKRRSSRHRRKPRSTCSVDQYPSGLAPNRRRAVEDNEGHLVYCDGDILHSRYELGRLLGEGTFGKVVDCKDLERGGKRCVIKIICKISDYYDLAKIEVHVLEKLNELDPEGKSGCVRMLDWFDFHGHICIVFNKLGHSVYEFLKRNCYRPFTMDQVQSISYQLCRAIKFCHDNRLVHTDLKPENILFRDSSFELCTDPTPHGARSWCRDYRSILRTDVEVIDFGSATFEDDTHTTVIGTRQYRAPEIVLERKWSYPCDVWSIGCIMFELYMGRTLFETHDSCEHLAIMQRILGPMPHSMIQKTRKRRRYFVNDKLAWNVHSSAGRRINRSYKPLKSFVITGSVKERQLFDLLSQMLRYKPSERITLANALRHPFFSSADL